MRNKYVWLMRFMMGATLLTIGASMTMGMSWLWSVGFFMGWLVTAWHFGRWLSKNEGKS